MNILIVVATVAVLALPPAAQGGTVVGADAQSQEIPEACRTAQLHVSIDQLSPGAGQRYAALGLANTSSHSCSLYGYPGLQLRNESGDVSTAVVHEPDQKPHPVVLAPGAIGWSLLHWTVIPDDGDPGQPEATSVRVTPPGETRFLTAPWCLGPVLQRGRIDVTAMSPERPDF